MFKFLTRILTTVAFFTLASAVYAASSVSVRLEHPQSPTNQNSLNLTFVALTSNNSAITVKCFKKSPSDGSFSQFGSDITLSAGGNTDVCPVSSSIISAEGSYNFYVTAADGSDSVTSDTVTVEYKTSGPGTPTNYSKEKISQCTYRISFKTADDGKTVKVELYRSETTSFSADGSTRVESKSIGSNTEASIENTVSGDCAKTYYFVIRAFDSAGNGSGTIGDSVTTVVASTTAAPQPTTGAIAVAKSQVSGQGSVLGKETQVASQGGVLGEATPSGTPASEEMTATKAPAQGQVSGISGKKIALGIVIILIVGGGVYYLYRRFAQG